MYQKVCEKNRQTIWVALEIKAVKETAIVITFAIHQTVRRFVITQRQSRAEKVIFWGLFIIMNQSTNYS